MEKIDAGKIKNLAGLARKAEQKMGRCRSKIPILDPATYRSIEEVYITGREALMFLASELEELTNT